MTQTRHEPIEGGALEAPLRPRRLRLLGLGAIVLGIGVAAATLAGPLVAGVIRYHVSEGALAQVIGGDIAGLLLVAPVSIVAGALILRGRRSGPVLALGPAFYALYMYSQLALGGDVVRYPGNSERFFLLFVGLVILAGAVAIGAWAAIGPASLPRGSRRLNRVLGLFSLVVAAFLTFGLHLPGLMDAWSPTPSSSEYLADPVVFWLVKFMDLALVVPALLAVGVTALRGSPRAGKARYAAVGWMALLGSSVAGMALAMQVEGDPSAAAANTVAFTVFALIAMTIAVMVYKPLFGGPRALRRRN